MIYYNKSEFSIPFGFSGGDTNLYGCVLCDPISFIGPEVYIFTSEFRAV